MKEVLFSDYSVILTANILFIDLCLDVIKIRLVGNIECEYTYENAEIAKKEFENIKAQLQEK